MGASGDDDQVEGGTDSIGFSLQATSTERDFFIAFAAILHF
ncbi:hypothetical protein [Verrucomicrobium spinosum]|nr:hypothetical protein [Verrucomicrobium spinosum]